MSWERSCYNAVVQLHALIESNRFAFVNIIGIMKQLDLAKQRKSLASAKQPAETTRVPVKKPVTDSLATQRAPHEEQRKREEIENHGVESSAASKGNPTPADPREHQAAEKEPTKIADKSVSWPISDRNKDSPKREDTVNRATLSFPSDEADRSSSIVTSRDTVNKSPSNSANLVSVSQLCNPNAIETSSPQQSIDHDSITDDPLFYVCTSFARTNSRKTQTLSHYHDTSSIAASLPSSLRSSQSFLYHDYCLSEREFNISPISQPYSTPSEMARMTARAKEAEIFRQIEGNAFDENAFFQGTQMPTRLKLFDDDDVAMINIS